MLASTSNATSSEIMTTAKSSKLKLDINTTKYNDEKTKMTKSKNSPDQKKNCDEENNAKKIIIELPKVR